MREILFRGKTKSFEWNYSSAIFPIDETVSIMLNERKPVLGVYDKTPDGEQDVLFNFTAVDSNTIGQFTGLTDKNGKKIFEGDIIIGRMSSEKYTVVWEECQFKIKDKYGNIYTPRQEFLNHLEIEIIGNVYDNPELLQVEV